MPRMGHAGLAQGPEICRTPSIACFDQQVLFCVSSGRNIRTMVSIYIAIPTCGSTAFFPIIDLVNCYHTLDKSFHFLALPIHNYTICIQVQLKGSLSCSFSFFLFPFLSHLSCLLSFMDPWVSYPPFRTPRSRRHHYQSREVAIRIWSWDRVDHATAGQAQAKPSWQQLRPT